jgi:hypothetical protein
MYLPTLPRIHSLSAHTILMQKSCCIPPSAFVNTSATISCDLSKHDLLPHTVSSKIMMSMCLVLTHVMGFSNSARDDRLSLLMFSSILSLLMMLSIFLNNRDSLTAAPAVMYFPTVATGHRASRDICLTALT